MGPEDGFHDTLPRAQSVNSKEAEDNGRWGEWGDGVGGRGAGRPSSQGGGYGKTENRTCVTSGRTLA